MANLTPTNLKVAQSKLTGKFASNEMRSDFSKHLSIYHWTYSVHAS